MKPKIHEHQWSHLVQHIDLCHHYTFTYKCNCGAIIYHDDERDPTYDPYSLIWMDREGTGTKCKRCNEIMNGSKIKSLTKIISKDGSTQSIEVNERDQERSDYL